MSEVAVKIYEIRRDIQRIHLSEPLYGKNGEHQFGKWVNSDTGEPVHFLTYHKIGHYRLEYTLVGVDMDNVGGPFDEVAGEHHICTNELHRNGEVSQWESSYFVSKANVDVPIIELEDLGPTTVIKHYYFLLRYLDE